MIFDCKPRFYLISYWFLNPNGRCGGAGGRNDFIWIHMVLKSLAFVQYDFISCPGPKIIYIHIESGRASSPALSNSCEIVWSPLHLESYIFGGWPFVRNSGIPRNEDDLKYAPMTLVGWGECKLNLHLAAKNYSNFYGIWAFARKLYKSIWGLDFKLKSNMLSCELWAQSLKTILLHIESVPMVPKNNMTFNWGLIISAHRLSGFIIWAQRPEAI